jgi:hypothetical protein
MYGIAGDHDVGLGQASDRHIPPLWPVVEEHVQQLGLGVLLHLAGPLHRTTRRVNREQE